MGSSSSRRPQPAASSPLPHRFSTGLTDVEDPQLNEVSGDSIYLRISNGRYSDVVWGLRPNSTVIELKQVLAPKFKITVQDQELFHDDRKLEDEMSLSDCCLQGGSELKLFPLPPPW